MRVPWKVTLAVPSGMSVRVSQLSRPVYRALVVWSKPWRLKGWSGQAGGARIVGCRFQIAAAMTKAWTSMPDACASAIRSARGSKPGASGLAGATISAGPSSESRYQESPRRRTCAKIAFARAAFALSTTATTSAWSLRLVLKVSTQKARYWPPGGSAASAANAEDSAAARTTRTTRRAGRDRRMGLLWIVPRAEL
jgi:hypothetical protein